MTIGKKKKKKRKYCNIYFADEKEDTKQLDVLPKAKQEIHGNISDLKNTSEASRSQNAITPARMHESFWYCNESLSVIYTPLQNANH